MDQALVEIYAPLTKKKHFRKMVKYNNNFTIILELKKILKKEKKKIVIYAWVGVKKRKKELE